MSTSAPEATIDAVLFDLDGTLLDTPRAIAEQLVVAVYETTGFLPAVAAAEGLVGRPLPQLCATLAGLDLTSPQVQEIVDAYRHLYRTRVVPEAAALALTVFCRSE